MTATPSFIIPGAMRSGTTSLSHWLSAHPDVFMPDVKEVHYFDRNHARGEEWYLQHFAGAREGQAVGEATPNYLYHQPALELIAKELPDVKLVILLRDPVERAHSHYLHNWARGRENLSFHDAPARETERLHTADEGTRAAYSYMDRGRYASQLEHALRLFPRGSMFIELFENLRDVPDSTFRRVAEFLEIDSSHQPTVLGRQVNAYQQFRSRRLRNWARSLPGPLRSAVGRLNRVDATYPEMSHKDRNFLDELFEAENRRLEQLAGVNLRPWSSKAGRAQS